MAVSRSTLPPPLARRDPPLVAMTLLGLALCGLVVFVVVSFVDRTTYDTWGGLLVAPVLFLLTLPMLRRQSARERNRTLFRLLILALAAKFLGIAARYFVEEVLYGGHADTNFYHKSGVLLSDQFRAGNFDVHLRSFTGTRFVRLATGVTYVFTGQSKFAGYVVFGWLAFLGTFFSYRAFTIAVPDGRRRTYARLVFFLPSMLFWPSATGKDAWMVFALGIAALGAAKILSGSGAKGIVTTALGLWLAALVRPHISGIVIVALVAALLLRAKRPDRGYFAPIVRVGSIAALLVVAVFFVGRAQEFLKISGVGAQGGLITALEDTAAQTSRGTSRFEPAIVRAPQDVPLAVVTVLFRPFPFEAHNALALATSAEGVFLLVVCLVRWRWIVAALRDWRRHPYVGFAIMASGLLIFALSSIGNFGLLARERAQMLPLLLVVLAVPPGRVAGNDAGDGDEPTDATGREEIARRSEPARVGARSGPRHERAPAPPKLPQAPEPPQARKSPQAPEEPPS